MLHQTLIPFTLASTRLKSTVHHATCQATAGGGYACHWRAWLKESNNCSIGPFNGQPLTLRFEECIG